MTRARRRGALFAVAGICGAIGFASPGCRTATQVTVELRTSQGLTCVDVKGVAIVVAETPSAAEGKMRLETLSAQVPRGTCGTDPHLLGTLVITPSGATGAIVVRARVSDAAEATCAPPDYRGCIVSRRAFAFIDHASATLPITLQLSCKDVPCDETTSCKTGKCFSSKAECTQENADCTSEAEPAGGTPDGGTPLDDAAPPDADPMVDAPADAPAETAPVDSGRPGPGNLCPTQSGDIDCHDQLGQPPCCLSMDPAPGQFICAGAPACPAASPRFSCTGTKHCDQGWYCCVATSNPTTAQCSSGPCMTIILCTSHGDCPQDRPSCSGMGPKIGNKEIHTCE